MLCRRKMTLPVPPLEEQRPQGFLLACDWAFSEDQQLTRTHSIFSGSQEPLKAHLRSPVSQAQGRDLCAEVRTDLAEAVGKGK